MGESKKQGNVDLSKEIFYQMIAPRDKTIQGWKYRCLMYRDTKNASGAIYGYVSEVLKEKVKLDRDYAEFKKPLKLGGGTIFISDNKSVTGCLIERNGKYYVVVSYYVDGYRLQNTRSTGIAWFKMERD